MPVTLTACAGTLTACAGNLYFSMLNDYYIATFQFPRFIVHNLKPLLKVRDMIVPHFSVLQALPCLGDL